MSVIRRSLKFVACFDGAYSHRRNANECIVDIIHPQDKKIFAYCIIEKSSGLRTSSDYHESSKSMEVTCLRVLLREFKKYDIFSGFCHDLDSSARKAIENEGLNLVEYFDPNHTYHHFDTIVCDVLKKYKNCLRGIKLKLQRHFHVCVSTVGLTNDMRKEKWRKCYDYFTAAESRWSGKNDTNCLKALNEVIERASTVFSHILEGARTQLNECFHSMKCRFADKRYSYPASWKLRVQMAILEFNWPGQWQLALAKRLNINLHLPTRIRLKKMYTNQAIKRLRKQEESYIKKERVRRAIIKNKAKTADAGSNDYVYHSSAKVTATPPLMDFDSGHITDKLPATSAIKPLPVKGVVLTSPERGKNDRRKAPSFRVAYLKCDILNNEEPDCEENSISRYEREYLIGSDDEDSIIVSSDDEDDIIDSSDESDEEFVPESDDVYDEEDDFVPFDEYESD